MLSELKKEIEDCEDEEKRERNRKKNMNQETIQQLTNYIQNHQKYIAKLEIILRKLNNHMIKPYDVLTLIDAMDNYIKSYHNPDYYVDEELFDDFDLNSTSEESDVDDVDDLSDSASVSVNHLFIMTYSIDIREKFNLDFNSFNKINFLNSHAFHYNSF